MTELTKEQNLALEEVRKVIYERLKNYYLSEEMLKDKSVFQLLCLLQLMVGHRNYLGNIHSHNPFA